MTSLQDALIKAGAVTEDDVNRVKRQRTIEKEYKRKLRERRKEQRRSSQAKRGAK